MNKLLNKIIFKLLQCVFIGMVFIIFRGILTVNSKSGSTKLENSADFANLMQSRVADVELKCNNKTQTANIKSGENLYVLYDRQLVWCPVFKAASTNWMYNLLPLAGLDSEDIENLRRDFGYKHPNMVAREVAPIMPYHVIQKILENEASVRFN